MAEKITDIFGEDSDKVLDLIKENAVNRACKELPFLKKNVETMQKFRGAVMEVSITVEHVYNHFLPFFSKRSEEEVLEMSFGNKILAVKEIIEKNIEKDDWRGKILSDLSEIRVIRNLFAHVPLDYQSEKLQFNKHNKYYLKEYDKKYQDMEVEEIAKLIETMSKEFTNELYKVMKILILKGINNPPPKK